MYNKANNIYVKNKIVYKISAIENNLIFKISFTTCLAC